MRLAEIIIEKIKKDGPITFRDFMEMALYYPQLGYYTRSEDKIGINGDYYTSSNLSAVFGAMIGRQLEEMWVISGDETFTIVEYGAGTGLLSHDILNYLKSNKPLYDHLNYCIIEKSAAMRLKEQTHLHEKVSWHNAIENLGEITGCVLSNELLDNFSVHLVNMEEMLMEVFVDYQNGFVELLKPAPTALTEYLAQQNITLPKGFRTEINLQAIEWVHEIANVLKKGFVLTIDYGYPASELYQNYRHSGTLMCYYKHSMNNNPYIHIGEQDITSHVNFSALYHWGLKYGLEYCGFTDQGHFLRGLGIADYLRALENTDKNDGDDHRSEALLAHNLLVDMGSKLKVLIQRKGIQPHELSGLKFSSYK